jgi:polysaccharide pyruvyl transferase WcaK-like protein
VKYSPNLGDGLLSECLERALVEHGADPSGTLSADLSARTAYAPGDASRGALLAGLGMMPRRLRRAAVRAPLALALRRRWRPHYERQLEGADAVVVGGGNLLTDMDLNFPTKVAAVLAMAAERKLPLAIYGVGVSAEWSPRGTALLRAALRAARPVHVSVRDTPSKANFDALFAEAAGRTAEVVPDPGLLAARYFPRRGGGGNGPIGLCVTSAAAVRYHSAERVTAASLASWYARLCTRLARSGRPVVAFTNASPEDEAFLDAVVDDLAAAAADGFERRRVSTPAELAHLIAGMDALVGHRMHALIAAYAFAVPLHALRWDRKVDSFMALIGQPERLSATTPETVHTVADDVLDRLGRRAVDPRRDRLVESALASVGPLSAALSSARPRAAPAPVHLPGIA